MLPAKWVGLQTKRTPKQQLVKNKRSGGSETPDGNLNQRGNTGVNPGLKGVKKTRARH